MTHPQSKKPSRGRASVPRRAFLLPIRKLFFQGCFCVRGSHRITRILTPDQKPKIDGFPRRFPPCRPARITGTKPAFPLPTKSTFDTS